MANGMSCNLSSGWAVNKIWLAIIWLCCWYPFVTSFSSRIYPTTPPPMPCHGCVDRRGGKHSRSELRSVSTAVWILPSGLSCDWDAADAECQNRSLIKGWMPQECVFCAQTNKTAEGCRSSCLILLLYVTSAHVWDCAQIDHGCSSLRGPTHLFHKGHLLWSS